MLLLFLCKIVISIFGKGNNFYKTNVLELRQTSNGGHRSAGIVSPFFYLLLLLK